MEIKSFFGRYFKYKLRGLSGTATALAIMNLLSVTLIAAMVMLTSNMMINLDLGYGGWEMLFLAELVLFVAVSSVVIITIMLAVTAVKNFDFYNKRVMTDVIGCLPLTREQRFWGDLLSGLAAHMISFIPCSAAGLIFICIAQNGVNRRYDLAELTESSDVIMSQKLIPTYLSLLLLLLIGYLGVYAVSCFFAVCCGRRGSALFYTASSLLLPLGIVITYCLCIYKDTIGLRVEDVISKAVPFMPGAGVWVGAVMRMLDGITFDYLLKGMRYLTDEPGYLAVGVLATAALTAGAYFLGKRRRAERTGRDFVFEGAYYVISALITAAAVGVALVLATGAARKIEPGDILIAALSAFVLHMLLELAHRRTPKKIRLSAVRFAVVCASCIGFIITGTATGGFGAEKYVPSFSSVEEIRIFGSMTPPYYLSYNNAFVYASDEAINALISEHRRITDHLEDGVATGSDLVITYVLKNGGHVRRFYGTQYGHIPPAFVKVYENIRKLEPTDSSALGVVSTRKYDDIWIYYSDSDKSDTDIKAGYITRGREKEFLDILKRDLINSQGAGLGEDKVGQVRIYYTYGGREHGEVHSVPHTYTDTLAFVSDPENLRGEPKTAGSGQYDFCWNIGYEDGTVQFLNVTVSENDEREEARELLSYIRSGSGDASMHLSVSSRGKYIGAYIAVSDEKAALRAMVKLARENFENSR